MESVSHRTIKGVKDVLLGSRIGRGAILKAMAHCHQDLTLAHVLWAGFVFGSSAAKADYIKYIPNLNFLNVAKSISIDLDAGLIQSQEAKNQSMNYAPLIHAEVQDFFHRYVAERLAIGEDVEYALTHASFTAYEEMPLLQGLRDKHLRIHHARHAPQVNQIGVPSFLSNLTQKAEQGKYTSVIGRDSEISQLIETLSRKKKANPVLLGDPGVGKTSVVEELARIIALEKAGVQIEGLTLPPSLKGIRLFEVSLNNMMAGTGTRGSLEGKFQELLTFASSHDDVILFIDEIHLLSGVGQGSLDAGNVLKPALAAGEIRVIGASTESEYRRSIEKDEALARRFSPIIVKEPDRDTSIEILSRVLNSYEAHHEAIATYPAVVACVELSMAHFSNRCLPDKAFDLLDEAMAVLKAEVRERNQKILAQSAGITKGETIALPPNSDLWPCLTPITVRKALAKKLGRPIEDLPWTLHKTIQTTDDGPSVRLKKQTRHIIGQSRAIDLMADALDLAELGLGDPLKPKGSFFCVGPSGVGKTELAKELSKATRLDLVRIDMSEFQEKHSVSRLLGSPPGYVGFDSDVSVLSQHFTSGKGAILLLDEIEKAHPDIAKIFLQILDAGRLTDTMGRELSFSNSYVVFTSNIGASAVLAIDGMDKMNPDDLGDLYRKEMRNHFAPEFIGRIKDIIPFDPLTREAMLHITQLRLAALSKQFLQKGIVVTIDDASVLFLAQLGFSSDLGARPLERVLEREYCLFIARVSRPSIRARDNDRVKVDIKLSIEGKLEAEVAFG